MRTKRNLYSTITLIVFALLFWASSSQKHIVSPLIVPDYSNSPQSPVVPGSAGIIIALFQPVYTGNFAYSSKSPFKQFRVSMGTDLEEILTARGYILKGPYDEYDLMTYSDKEQCMLGLFSRIDLNITRTSGGWTQHSSRQIAKGYSEFEGTITLSGKITFFISETFTQQKLLVKSLSIPQQIDIPVKAEGRYHYGMNPDAIPLDDPGVHNPIASSLVEFYKTTMKRAWDLLQKEELLRISDQVPEIRENAGFIKR
jgi:hypothetical protein